MIEPMVHENMIYELITKVIHELLPPFLFTVLTPWKANLMQSNLNSSYLAVSEYLKLNIILDWEASSISFYS